MPNRESQETDFIRKTKIVCTIGTKYNSEEMMKELMLAGMDGARFDFSHGTR